MILSMMLTATSMMMKLTKLRKRRRAKGIADHQSRNTMMRAKAQMRKRAFARKNGANLNMKINLI